ncbi:MAG: Rpn family recombination-promoting nuclease/putative transposase [Saprospiraceae bacterium]|nr:Rpn family recombination-promoting nuclease/putative transposase [Saprospiraceae bacterium]
MSKKSIRPRHDQFMKYLMKDLSFTKAFLDFLLPDNFRRELNLSDLKDAKSSFVDEQLSEHFADAVFEVPYTNFPDEMTNLVILFEHKSYKDEQLPYQLLRYLSNGYIHQIINGQPKMPIITVIFYHGKDKWDLQKIRSGFSEVHTPHLSYVPEMNWVFINTNDLDETALLQLTNTLVRSVLLTKKYSHNVPALIERIGTIIAPLQEINPSLRITILLYLSSLVPVKDDIITIIHQKDPQMAEEFISFYDFYIQQAEEKGMEKGMEKGRENEKVALILKASLEGLSLNLISRIVDLSEEEVAAIIRKQQKQ